MNIRAILAIVFVFVGCASNVLYLEILVTKDAGSGNLITFLQFLFISLEGFIFTAKLGSKKPTIGLLDYFYLVVMFFITNLCNNYAFNFNIPMPLHIIFRAGSLITNMIMGVLILKKRYTLVKYLSVLLITTGIVLCTIESGKDVKATGRQPAPSTPATDLFWWIVGILLLTVALFISARMGLYQEVLYSRYGKHPREALFYTHLLPLPGFLFLGSNIWSHTVIALESAPMTIPFLGLTLPTMVVYLVLNTLSQYVCISSVYLLTTECSSLTVTLVLTLRKFASLLFSIVYFQNPFTAVHWLGTVLVFTGTVIFTELPHRIAALWSHRTDTSQKKIQ